MPFWYIPPCLRQCSDDQEHRQRLAKVGIFLHTHVHHSCASLYTLAYWYIGCSYSEGKDGGGGDDDDELSATTRPPKLPQDDAVCSASYKGGHGLCLGRSGEIGTRYRSLRTRDIFWITFICSCIAVYLQAEVILFQYFSLYLSFRNKRCYGDGIYMFDP